MSYNERRKAEASERWRLAVEMRKRGAKYWQIAERLRVSIPRAFDLVLKGESL